ncbi:MAG: lectin-like protein [Planctomycetota bacterium]|nr:lectin-like protein [Planctomycetota bacterium]
MTTAMTMRKRTASCFAALVLGTVGCIPPADRFEKNTTQAPDPPAVSNTTQIDDSAHVPRPNRSAQKLDTRDVDTRIRELQLQIEEKKAELHLMEQTLGELRQVRQADRSIAARPPQSVQPHGDHAPPAAAQADKQFVPREIPPLLPEPALPAEQLIESYLDDIDRVVAELDAVRNGKLASYLARSVIDARSRLRDPDASFAPLAARELHVVGLYEGVEFEIGRQRAEVRVTYTGSPIVLCLTSYEKIHWTVKLAEGVELESIILGGRLQFLVDPPPGVEVIDCTAENAGTKPLDSAYARHSSDSSGSRFPRLAKQLKDITGLEVTTFQGDYRYSGKPIVVGPSSNAWRQERVLAELREIQREATSSERLQQWHRMKELNFTAIHYRFDSGGQRHAMDHHGVTGSIGPFTPLGPELSRHTPFPADVSCPVADADDGQFYAIAGHGLVQVNQRGGKHFDLHPPKDFPDVSWPCGLAFDTKRRRVVMVSLGGTGYMYGYEPATEKWTLMADMKEAGLVPFVYMPRQDEFLGLQVEHGGGNQLYRYDHEGKFLGKTRLSQSLLQQGAKHSHCQAIPVEDLLVFLIGAEHVTPEGDRAVRAFVVNPDSGEVLFSILHDDETLRAIAEADVAAAPDWITNAKLATSAPTRQPLSDAVDRPVAAEAVLADLRRQSEQGIDEAPELHVIGFYEPGHPIDRISGGERSIDVRIKPSTKPIVAALTAYESTHWKVTIDPGANVAAIILSGYHSHTAEGVPADVPLIKMSYDDGSRNYFYGFDTKRRDYDEMLQKARKVTGLEVLTFQGSYTPSPGATYRIRPAVPGDYKAVRARLDAEHQTGKLLEEARQRAAKDVVAGKFPPGTIEFGGHHYAVFETRKSWEQAREDCQARGGDLVCIDDEREQRLVQALAAGAEVWLGGSREPTDKQWKWISGEAITYTNWGSGEPGNSGGGENRIEMWPNGQWNDQPAHDQQPYVCEWGP